MSDAPSPSRHNAGQHADLPENLRVDLRRLYASPTDSARRAFPPDLDAEVLAVARERLARPRVITRQPAWRVWGTSSGLATAAALALITYVAWPTRVPPPNAPGTGGPIIAANTGTDDRASKPGPSILALRTGSADRDAAGAGLVQLDAPTSALSDLNHDGRVDILDARVLALALRESGPAGRGEASLRFGPPTSADIDHDGTIDQRDVDALAMLAVRLPVSPPDPTAPATPATTGTPGGGS